MPTAAPASTASVADELVNLCRDGRNLDAVAKLYDPNIVSIEPIGSETMPAEMSGIDAVRAKNEWWYDTYEVNSVDVQGPFVGRSSSPYDTTSRPRPRPPVNAPG